MSFVAWQDKLALGIEEIDNDHKGLFDLFNQLHDTYAGGQGDEALDAVFGVLIDYTENHFRREEKLMARHGYPGLAAHREAHKNLKKEVLRLYGQFKDGGEKGMCLELLGFLSNWLYFHIMEEDQAIKASIDRET